MPSPRPDGGPAVEAEDASPHGPRPDSWPAPAPGEEGLDGLVRTLLRLRGGSDAERTLVRVARDLASASWAAFYAPEGRAHHCRAGVPSDIAFPAIPADLMRAVVGDRRAPWLCGRSTALRAYCPPDVHAVVPVEAAGDGPGPVFLLGSPARGMLGQGDLQRLAQLAAWSAPALEAARAFDDLRSQVVTDSLTGCFNRRGFDEHLEVEWVRARRYRRRFALLLLDVDRFKQVNDAVGHRTGDHVLQQIGQTLRSTFRVTDRICRFGGDEFAVVFPETVKADAMHLANRLRGRIAALFPDPVLPMSVTVSVGVSAFPDDAGGPEALLLEADRALYRAKAAGGDQVAGV
jgi:diguanylate cyclase (GGDEF)-like protein